MGQQTEQLIHEWCRTGAVLSLSCSAVSYVIFI